MITIKLEGIEEAIRALEKMGSIGKKYTMKALEETAAESVGVMKLAATPSVITNRLRSSLHYEKPDTRIYDYSDNRGKSYRGKFQETPRGLQIIVGSNVEYADSVNQFSKRSPGFFEEGVEHAQKIIETRMRVNWGKATKEALGG